MRRLVLLVTVLVLAALPARAADFLNTPADFAAAWARLVMRMTDRVDVSAITVTPDRIEVRARAAVGGARLDDWLVRHVDTIALRGIVVDGPLPRPDNAPPAQVEATFFPLPSVPLDRIGDIVTAAVSQARLAAPGRATRLHLARPEGTTLAPLWTIEVEAPGERATLRMALDGTLVASDLSGTIAQRPAPKPPAPRPLSNPLADALAAFRASIGTAPVVWAIEAASPRYVLRVTDPGNTDRLIALTWDGTAITQETVPAPAALRAGQSAFPMAEAAPDRLPFIIAAARAAAGREALQVRSVTALKQAFSPGPPRVIWRVAINPGPPGAPATDITTVTLAPDATVLSVLRPASERAPLAGTTGPGMIAAFAQITALYGAQAKVWEIDIRPERIRLGLPHATDPQMTANVLLTDRGLRNLPDFPLMMQTDADLFPLSVLAPLTPDRIDLIKTRAVAALAIPGAEVSRLRIWSGSPFWRAPDGRPLIDVRVGVPPSHSNGGYAVFTLDGDLVEAIR